MKLSILFKLTLNDNFLCKSCARWIAVVFSFSHIWSNQKQNCHHLRLLINDFQMNPKMVTALMTHVELIFPVGCCSELWSDPIIWHTGVNVLLIVLSAARMMDIPARSGHGVGSKVHFAFWATPPKFRAECLQTLRDGEVEEESAAPSSIYATIPT